MKEDWIYKVTATEAAHGKFPFPTGEIVLNPGDELKLVIIRADEPPKPITFREFI